MSEVQAKRGYLRVERKLKNGRLKRAQQDCIVSAGMYDAKSIERDLWRAADEATARGEKVLDAVVETYGSREVAPCAWTPLLEERSTQRVSGFHSPYNQWQPESPLIAAMAQRQLAASQQDKSRRKEGTPGGVTESG